MPREIHIKGDPVSGIKLSILMSVYNGEKYLAEAVDSMLNQTYSSFEFIIVDDASTDSTPEILASCAEVDDRIRVCRNDVNLGLTKSLNKGLTIASGEYVARMDADDVSLPQRLERQVSFLDSHPDAVLVTGWIQNIDAEGNYLSRLEKEVEPGMVNWFLMFYNYIGGHGQVTFRKSAVLKVGGYNEELRYAQDYALWTRICTIGELCVLQEVMMLYRLHDQNLSVLHRQEQSQCSYRISRAMMSQIMENAPGDAVMASLERFWHWDFSPVDEVKLIHSELCRIFAAFGVANVKDNSAKRLRQIRRVIGRQFLRWTYGLVKAKQFRQGFSSFWCATCWLRLYILPSLLRFVMKKICATPCAAGDS